MIDTPREAWIESQFCCEDNIQKFLARFDDGHRLGYPEKLRGETFNRFVALSQVDIPGAGRADVVVVRASENYRLMTIVIELKRIADEGAVAQVLRYCGALETTFPQYQSLWAVPIVGALEFTPGATLAAYAGNVGLLALGIGKLEFAAQHHIMSDPNFPNHRGWGVIESAVDTLLKD